MSWPTTLKWSFVVLLLLTIVAFTMQNMSRTTGLSLNLGLWAWRLRQPVAIPALIWGSFGLGLVVAGGWGWVRSSALTRRVRKLEQELALTSVRGGGTDWARSDGGGKA